MPGDVLRPWRHLLPRPTADRYQQRLRLSTEASAFKKLDTSREKAGQESIRPYCSWLNSRSSDSSLPCADCLDFSAMPNSISYSIALPATSAWFCKNPLGWSARAADSHISAALPMQTMPEISVEKKRKLKLAPPPDITGRVRLSQRA